MRLQEPAPYYNNLQLAVKFSSVPHKMIISGRGTGKTTIHAEDFIEDICDMPRGKFAFGGLTYFHVRTKSMPVIIDQWERRKIYRDIHYTIGHKAPKKWRWDEPYQPPLDYSNCIHFWNGCVIEFISFDRPEMARSGSYDTMKFDEAQRLKKSAIDADILPANRGNRDRFGHKRRHHGTLFTGTMPLVQDGDWVFEYEELMKQDPRMYLYLEASARINQHILGDEYFRQLKRTLPDIIYRTEIENERVNFNVSSFYPMLSDKHLYYKSYDYSFIDSISLDKTAHQSPDSRSDIDCDKNKPLYISMDFGSRINCMVVCQDHGMEFRILKNFYVENNIFQTIVNEFVDYYQYHKDKSVFLYGGSDGMRRNNAGVNENYFDVVIDMLTKAGWRVYNQAQLSEINHMDKHLFYNIALKEEGTAIPALRINQNNANETYISMRNAPILSTEIKKDKRSEKSDSLAQWKSTHLSDAVDNVYYWLYNHLAGTQQGHSYDLMILGKE
jgi:hypothetical protein